MKYLYLSLLMFVTATVTAQKKSFQSAVGIGGIGGYHYGALAFSFEPRFNFYEFSEKESLSVGACFAMGPSIGSDRRTDRDKISGGPIQPGWMVNIPVTVNYTFGNAATPRSYKYIGYSVGAGYAAHNGRRYVDPGPGIDTVEVHAHGLVLDGRINFPRGNSSWSLQSSYMFNFSNNNPDIKGIFSMSLLYNIGIRIHQHREKRHYDHPREYYHELDREMRKKKMESRRKIMAPRGSSNQNLRESRDSLQQIPPDQKQLP
ncbi:hypothetical protein AB6805_10640 [Chitinophaga sp. RCC_12]|uniref:hypothetical protein n=1 Tax=Chitinophaga sp. RCC_12 TaxID=3239226 RepID=UPI003526A246